MDDYLNIGGSIGIPEEDINDKSIYIKVVGVGGGGGNAVNYMYKQGIEGVSFALINTDRMALRSSPVPYKVQIGNGLGAGNKPEKAKRFAEEDIEKIEAMFDDGTEMVFITAGMGGGTGTGAGPVVARVAKEKGLLTIGIVTIPFLFEGESKINKALDGAEEIAKYVDALLIIQNERLAEIYGDLDFINGFAKADETLASAARSISEIITSEGYINLDFNDVDTTLRDGGSAIISTGFGEGENRVSKAIEMALKSPLLKHREIMGSHKLLFNVYFSRNAQQKFQLKEIDELTKFVQTIDKGVDVIWGAAFDDSLGEQVKITILASGFDAAIREEVESPEFKLPFGKKQKEPSAQKGEKQPTTIDRIRDTYGDKVDTYRTNYIVLSRDEMDNDVAIETLEKSPAFNRTRETVTEMREKMKPENTPRRGNSGFSKGNMINFLGD
ncbi:MAG: cell division protein FtsZ [Paramuribaculum sp.]|nr:cell division protein FtsZ [Paramuribaculum sp.]